MLYLPDFIFGPTDCVLVFIFMLHYIDLYWLPFWIILHIVKCYFCVWVCAADRPSAPGPVLLRWWRAEPGGHWAGQSGWTEGPSEMYAAGQPVPLLSGQWCTLTSVHLFNTLYVLQLNCSYNCPFYGGGKHEETCDIQWLCWVLR